MLIFAICIYVCKYIHLNTHTRAHICSESLCLACKLMKAEIFVWFIAVSPAHVSIPDT